MSYIRDTLEYLIEGTEDEEEKQEANKCRERILALPHSNTQERREA